MRTTIQQYTWFWKSWEQLSISFFVKLIIHNVGLVWCKVHVDGVIPISDASLPHQRSVDISKPAVLMGLWLVIFCNTCTYSLVRAAVGQVLVVVDKEREIAGAGHKPLWSQVRPSTPAGVYIHPPLLPLDKGVVDLRSLWGAGREDGRCRRGGACQEGQREGREHWWGSEKDRRSSKTTTATAAWDSRGRRSLYQSDRRLPEGCSPSQSWMAGGWRRWWWGGGNGQEEAKVLRVIKRDSRL